MNFRSFSHQFALVTCATFFCVGSIHAQGAAKQEAIDPQSMYFEAWMKVREAEELSKENLYLESFEKYQSAQKLFGTIMSFHPEWKTEMVKNRVQKTEQAIIAIQPEAIKQQDAKKNQVKALFVEQDQNKEMIEGQPVAPVANANVAPVPKVNTQPNPPPRPAASTYNNNGNGNVALINREIQQLRTQLDTANRDRDANAAQLRRTIAELETERARQANAAVQGEMESLNKKIKRVEQENMAMAIALKKSRAEKQQSDAELEKIQAEMQLSETQAKEVERKLQTERTTNNALVDGLRRQLKTMQEDLGQKNQAILALQNRVTETQTQLQQSHDTITELKKERDTLLGERDQLTSLLSLNEGDRVQKLIEQKMELATQLRELRDSVKILSEDNNATKDELLNERRNVAIVKKQLMDLQQEQADKDQRLQDLTQRLKEAKNDLDTDAGSGAANSEETAMLRDIIKRQQKVQERQQSYKDVLIERAMELNVAQELRAPLENLLGEKLTLTEEEQLLIEPTTSADGEFFNPNAAPEKVRKLAGAELDDKIQGLTSAATRAFGAKRYSATREVLEIILDDSPGHVPSLCNLGIVNLQTGDHMKAEENFRTAVAMREENPYAHYGLGATLLNQNRIEEARAAFERCIQLDSNKAEAHVFLGNIAGQSNDLPKAEEHFNSAVKINPTLSEPYYNLALIKRSGGDTALARDYYNKAIQNGAIADPEFERSIGQIEELAAPVSNIPPSASN